MKTVLAVTHPVLAAEWHREKNGDLTPERITAGSDRKVWWQCSEDAMHEWLASVSSRVRGRGCPICTNKMVTPSNALRARQPQLTLEWHPTKNGGLTPDDVVSGSHKKVWWQCQRDSSHEWQACVVDRTGGKGCPFCSGHSVTATTSLQTLYPSLAEEWHEERNGNLLPEHVKPGSHQKVWWRCRKNPAHVWGTAVKDRTQGNGCPFCANQRVTLETSLFSQYPLLAEEWHPLRNGTLTPMNVVSGSKKKVWWLCRTDPSHEWEAAIYSRVRGHGCPMCRGLVATLSTSLQAYYPDLVTEWHPHKNGTLTPADVKPKSNKKVWWRCRIDSSHEWLAVIASRVKGSGCPMCSGRIATPTTSLLALYPELAQEWHLTKNGQLTPDQVTTGSHQKVWWRCRKETTHEWEVAVSGRTGKQSGCPFCANQQVTATNSLQTLYPHLAEEWHPTKNGECTPDQFVPGSGQKVWWCCQVDEAHEWLAEIRSRANGGGCPYCSNKAVTSSNSLLALHPHLAEEWHPTKNGECTPDQFVPGSGYNAWWRCPVNHAHEWEARISHRVRGSGCPYCSGGWTISAIRLFVTSLRDHLQVLTPAELYLLFQQSGMQAATGKGKGFIKSLMTGRFPLEELDKFIAGDPSLVDQFIKDSAYTLEEGEEREPGHDGINGSKEEEMPLLEDIPLIQDDDSSKDFGNPLPIVETKAVLAAIGHLITSSSDEEAIEFLISSAVAKIWKHAFHDEREAVAQAEQESSNKYTEQVRTRFMNEYRHAKALSLPPGYDFHDVQGNFIDPNLMQRLVAIRVRNARRVGNWSGTGAGKTLSALLASRVIGAGLTVICCPNSVVEGWQDTIDESFPQCQVRSKTFTPHWDEESDGSLGFGLDGKKRLPRYLVINYEAFQQPNSATSIRGFIEQEQIDCVIIDEIHYTKQRTIENMSLRRRMVGALVTQAAEQNPDLAVLGLSATPVINNLQEGKSMVELVTGVAHDDLVTRPTVSNCMILHQHLARLGIRWMPEYQTGYEQYEVKVDCASFLDEIRALDQHGSPLALEQILTRARLPAIQQQIIPKTLIYTHLIQGIDRLLWKALTADGWKVGFYTGEDKSGLAGFLHGDIDVLVGTSAIGTGVDGLQQVCNRLIINVLPWTAAEFEQLKGRLFRQGQQRSVTMILPLTYALIKGERWSWCESKLQRLRFKKSISDAAVDGIVPEGHLRSPAQAYQDLMAWLNRLDNGDVQMINHPRIVVPLPDNADRQRRKRQYGTFSRMNHRWNQGRSEQTHRRLQENQEEWAQYHTLYREQRKEWAVVPYEELIRWCQQRSGKAIGDFGCGEAFLAAAVSDCHTVYSIDHVAINDDVIVCDMAHVPLDDESLDVAMFSLSLMGTNFTDYLREAHRTLKLDGHLHIIEATERFTNREQFAKGLEHLGFDLIRVQDLWKFTYIRAIKTEQRGRKDIELQF